MKVENKYNAQSNKVKLWCGMCSKELYQEDYGMEVFAPGIIDMLNEAGMRHEQRHPRHNPTLMITHRLPTNAEIRSGKSSDNS